MKKLLVCTLILCMASMASALNEIQISAHAVPPMGQTWDANNPTDSDIYLAPSDHLVLDIYANVQLNAGFGLTWAMISTTPLCGTISAANAVINPAYDGAETMEPWDIGYVAIGGPFPYEGTPTGFYGGVVVYEGSIPAKTWLINGIDFHCESPNNDAIIQLIKLDDGTGLPTGEIYDTLIVHQIPEPATIALLCLGGLLLRKKK